MEKIITAIEPSEETMAQHGGIDRPKIKPILIPHDRNRLKEMWCNFLERIGDTDKKAQKRSSKLFLKDYEKCLLEYYESIGIADEVSIRENKQAEVKYANILFRGKSVVDIQLWKHFAVAHGANPKSRVELAKFYHDFERRKSFEEEAFCLLQDQPILPGQNKVAFMLAKKASVFESPFALNLLALCYLEGIGVSPDVFEAERLIRIAYQKDNGDARTNLMLARILLYSGKTDEALELLEKLAESGNPEIVGYANEMKCGI